MEDSKSQPKESSAKEQEKPLVHESEMKDQEKAAAPDSEKAASGGATLRKSITIEISKDSDTGEAGEKPEASPITSETTSGIDVGSDPPTSPYAVSTETGSDPPGSPYAVSTDTGSDPNIITSAADTPGDVSPPVKTRGKFWSFFSPNKKDKNAATPKEKPRSRFSFSRMKGSKSVSPEKSLKIVAESDPVQPVEGACAKPVDNSEKAEKGLYVRIRRTFSVIMGKKSSSESESLVTSQEKSKIDSNEPQKQETEKILESDENTRIIYWKDNRTSLVSDWSGSVTETTAVPSTCSGSDFAPEGGAKSSDGENASHGAVEGSTESSNENIPNAEKDDLGSKVQNGEKKNGNACSNDNEETNNENMESVEIPDSTTDDKHDSKLDA